MSVDRLAETMTGAIAFTVVPLSVTISTFSAGIFMRPSGSKTLIPLSLFFSKRDPLNFSC